MFLFYMYTCEIMEHQVMNIVSNVMEKSGQSHWKFIGINVFEHCYMDKKQYIS